MSKKSREWEKWIAQNPGRVEGSIQPGLTQAHRPAPSDPGLSVLDTGEVLCTLPGICLQLGLRKRDELVRVEVDDVGPSLNEFFGRAHWAKRKELVDAWHSKVYAWLHEHPQVDIREPAEALLFCTFRPGREGQDGINLSPTCKMMEDALVKVGTLPEDNGGWIRFHHLVGRPGVADRSTLVYFKSR